MKQFRYTVEYMGDWQTNRFDKTLRRRGPGWLFSTDSLDNLSPFDRDLFLAMMRKGTYVTRTLDHVYRIRQEIPEKCYSAAPEDQPKANPNPS